MSARNGKKLPLRMQDLSAFRRAAARIRLEVETGTAPGALMDDGSVFCGLSPDTGLPLYTTPKDNGDTTSFFGAETYVQKLNDEKALGHDDWRLPTAREQALMWQHHDAPNLKDTFSCRAWYWGKDMQMQYFGGGQQTVGKAHNIGFVRCVR